jgi:hypothetical protein
MADILCVRVTIFHGCKHEHYTDVSMPVEALEFIHDNIDLTPTLLFSKITENWPDVERNQVYSAWSRKAEGLWKNDDDPVASVTALLKKWEGDADVFNLTLDEGVIGIAWGIKQVAKRLKGMIVEIAIDATCKYFHKCQYQ